MTERYTHKVRKISSNLSGFNGVGFTPGFRAAKIGFTVGFCGLGGGDIFEKGDGGIFIPVNILV